MRHEVAEIQAEAAADQCAAAMCANDFRFSSHASHFSALRPTAKLKLNTFRLCHTTSTGSATSPSILRDILLTSPP